MTVSPTSLTIPKNGGQTLSVTLGSVIGTATITSSSSNTGQIQITPASRSLTGSGTVTFNVTVKTKSGSVTISPSCGSARSVPITVQ